MMVRRLLRLFGPTLLCITMAACGDTLMNSVPREISAAAPMPLPERALGSIYTGAPGAVIFTVATRSAVRVALPAADDVLPAPSMSNDGPPAGNNPYIVGPSENARVVRVTGTGPSGGYSCSGTMIGQSLVLTAGHCVHSLGTPSSPGVWYSNIRASLGYERGRTRYGPYDAQRIISFTGWIDGNDFAHDVAVIQLNLGADAQTHDFYGIQALDWHCDALGNLPSHYFVKRFYSADYNSDEEQGWTVGNHGGCQNGLLATRAMTGHGSSGSGALDPTGLFVYAVTSNESIAIREQYDAVLTRAKLCFIMLYSDDNAVPCPGYNRPPGS